MLLGPVTEATLSDAVRTNHLRLALREGEGIADGRAAAGDDHAAGLLGVDPGHDGQRRIRRVQAGLLLEADHVACSFRRGGPRAAHRAAASSRAWSAAFLFAEKS